MSAAHERWWIAARIHDDWCLRRAIPVFAGHLAPRFEGAVVVVESMGTESATLDLARHVRDALNAALETTGGAS